MRCLLEVHIEGLWITVFVLIEERIAPRSKKLVRIFVCLFFFFFFYKMNVSRQIFHSRTPCSLPYITHRPDNSIHDGQYQTVEVPA